MLYPGGKNGAGVYQTIINQIPPHAVFIEPFAGSAAIMGNKRPARVNIAIDLDGTARAGIGAMEGVEFVCGCGMAFLEGYRWTGREFVYADPPYVLSSRRSRRPIYRYEMSDTDHRRLLSILLELPCLVMVSGYWSAMYGEALDGWRVVTYRAQTRGGTPALEYLWMNYPVPVALHDYGHLGRDYRERERIKRKVGRWQVKLAGLGDLERCAILSALQEL